MVASGGVSGDTAFYLVIAIGVFGVFKLLKAFLHVPGLGIFASRSTKSFIRKRSPGSGSNDFCIDGATDLVCTRCRAALTLLTREASLPIYKGECVHNLGTDHQRDVVQYKCLT